MNSIVHDNVDALSLYRKGYQGWVRNSTLDVKTYYERLCNAVVIEYKTQGFCNLVDEIIEERKGIEMISYHSFIEAREILQGHNKTDHGKYAPVLDPYAKAEYYTWDGWTKSLQQKGKGRTYLYESTECMLLDLRKSGQACHIAVLNNNQKGEKKKTQIKIISDEEKRNADQILIKAKEDSRRIVEEARVEAERIRNEAYKDAAINKQISEVSLLSKKTIQEYLGKEREMIRMTLDKEYEKVLDESHATLGTAERIHNEMCDQTNKLQASWVKALDQTVEELTTIKEDFYKRIHNWQVGLYPHELRPFAERYIELYRIVNVDKIIAEELFRINTGNNANEGEQETARKQSENDKNVITIDETPKKDLLQKYNSSPVLEELEKLNRKLSIFLKKFESSLNGLDMYVYRPENGEVYDEVWHVVEDDSEFDYSKEYHVVRCILPGVAKKVNDDDEDDVIIPAIVEV